MNPYRLRAYLMLILVALIWGAAGPVIKFTLGKIDPLPFLAYRFAIASIFSFSFFVYKIKKGKKFKRLRTHLPLAMLYGLLAIPIGLGILFLALDKTTVLDLTLIGVFAPMLITGGGALFFHEHVTHREKIGIAVVLAGVALNSIFPIFKSGSGLRLTGNLLLFLYLLVDAGSVLVAKRAVRLKIKSANLTNLAFIIGAATIIPLTAGVYGVKNLVNIVISLPWEYHLGVWYMALLSGNLAYFLYVRGQRTIEVSEAILFNYLQPIFAVPLAVFWLGEKVTSHFIIGAIVIASGVVIAEYKRSLRLRLKRSLAK